MLPKGRGGQVPYRKGENGRGPYIDAVVHDDGVYVRFAPGRVYEVVPADGRASPRLPWDMSQIRPGEIPRGKASALP